MSLAQIPKYQTDVLRSRGQQLSSYWGANRREMNERGKPVLPSALLRHWSTKHIADYTPVDWFYCQISALSPYGHAFPSLPLHCLRCWSSSSQGMLESPHPCSALSPWSPAYTHINTTAAHDPGLTAALGKLSHPLKRREHSQKSRSSSE